MHYYKHRESHTMLFFLQVLDTILICLYKDGPFLGPINEFIPRVAIGRSAMGKAFTLSLKQATLRVV